MSPLPLEGGYVQEAPIQQNLTKIAAQFPISSDNFAPETFAVLQSTASITVAYQGAANDQYTTLTGASYTTIGGGDWLLWGVFSFEHTAAGGVLAEGFLAVDGAIQSGEALLHEAIVGGGGGGTCTQIWRLTNVALGSVLTLHAHKFANAGTLLAYANDTRLTGLRLAFT